MTHVEIKEAFLKGGKLAIERLIDRKQKEDGYLVFSDNGKIVKIKAKDIKL